MAGDGDPPSSGGATTATRPASSMSAREEVGPTASFLHLQENLLVSTCPSLKLLLMFSCSSSHPVYPEFPAAAPTLPPTLPFSPSPLLTFSVSLFISDLCVY